jgi:hypothetical protein
LAAIAIPASTIPLNERWPGISWEGAALHGAKAIRHLASAALLAAAGCAAPAPPEASPDHVARLIEQTHSPIAVRAVALGRGETRVALGLDLNDLDIQPVWIEVDNDHHEGFWLFPHAVDEDYFPP